MTEQYGLSWVKEFMRLCEDTNKDEHGIINTFHAYAKQKEKEHAQRWEDAKKEEAN